MKQVEPFITSGTVQYKKKWSPNTWVSEWAEFNVPLDTL